MPSFKSIGLVAGPLAALLCYLLLPATYSGQGAESIAFAPAGRATLALALWMAIWWLSEALPLAATALLPLAFLPLVGVASVAQAAQPYGSDVIWLFFGGFVLAGAIQRWGLDRRMAFQTLRVVGSRPAAMTGGVMGATAFVSMWVSNTATAAMMTPIALAIIDLVLRQRTGEGLAGHGGIPAELRAERNFALGLLLGVAYAASIGGLATIVGSPPNGILARYIAQSYGEEISFLRWMTVALPLAAVLLALAWWLLTQRLFASGLPSVSGGRSWIAAELEKLGPLSRGERTTLAVFAATVLLWVLRPALASIEVGSLRPFAGLSDTGIAVLAALALFTLPVGEGRRAADWDTAKRIPWDVLLLFGGGLSLAAAIDGSGAAGFLASLAGGLAAWPALALVLLLVALATFASELTSNTAQVATMLPLLAAVAPAAGLHPYYLIVPCTLAASAAFMMPVGTPPNAIVFGTGLITIGEMCRAGFWLNLIAIAAITLFGWFVMVPFLIGK